MNFIKILVDGIDVTDFIHEIPELVFSSGDYGDFVVIESFTLKGDNSKYFWSRTHKNSILYNKDFSSWKVCLINTVDNSIIYSGFITGIKLTNNLLDADITVSSSLNRILNSQTGLYVSDIMTPAEIFLDLATLWGLDYDITSILKSQQNQEEMAVYISANIDYTHNLSLLDAFKMLADIGIARIYLWQDKIFYQSYNLTQDEPNSIEIDSKYIYQIESIETCNKSEITGYEINTITTDISSGSPNSDSQHNNLKSIDLSAGKPFSMYSINGAYNIGESYIALSNRDCTLCTMTVSKQIGMILRPTSVINVVSSKLLSSDIVFEVLSVDNSNSLYSKIELSSV